MTTLPSGACSGAEAREISLRGSCLCGQGSYARDEPYRCECVSGLWSCKRRPASGMCGRCPIDESGKVGDPIMANCFVDSDECPVGCCTLRGVRVDTTLACVEPNERVLACYQDLDPRCPSGNATEGCLVHRGLAGKEVFRTPTVNGEYRDFDDFSPCDSETRGQAERIRDVCR